MAQYQTVKYPDGLVVQGVFPTLEWFEKIASHVSFSKRTVLDIGAAEGMYSVLAAQNGAERVVCIDSEINKTTTCSRLFELYGLNLEVYLTSFEDMAFDTDYDIVFCNMILHWLKDAQNEFRRIADGTREYLVVIYREENEHYQDGWFPSSEELNQLAESVGLKCVHTETLIVQDHEKKVNLAIFKKDKKFSVQGVVTKVSSIYTDEWRKQAELINTFLKQPVVFGTGNYTMTYIDGRDLFGDRPFRPTHGKNRTVFLSSQARKSVEALIGNVIQAGEETGYYLQDINARNILVKGDVAYLIDFDHIGKEMPKIHARY